MTALLVVLIPVLLALFAFAMEHIESSMLHSPKLEAELAGTATTTESVERTGDPDLDAAAA